MNTEEGQTRMPLDPLLLELLACPEDKGSLLYFADEEVLYNPRLRRSYPVRDDIPVMLIDEATVVPAAEHERLSARAAKEKLVPTGAPRSGDVTPKSARS
jgi:uncharacterized protein YbaR (Trm112 family)